MMASHWTFVAAAYGITAIGTLVILLQSWRWMRQSETRVDQLMQQRRDTPRNTPEP